MNDIAACEQRISLALARIDRGIDRLQQQAAQRATDAAATGPAAMAAERADLQRRQQAALDQAQARLVAAGTGAAQLAAANDRLIAANRALIAAQDSTRQADAARAALEAEIEAIGAARAAEVAQMGHVLATLEAMLGIGADEAVDEAGFDADVEALPHEGRILRFGREAGPSADNDSAGDGDRAGADNRDPAGADSGDPAGTDSDDDTNMNGERG